MTGIPWLTLDPAQETERLVEGLRAEVHTNLRKQGAVVGVSGGIDSAVVLALTVRAFGPERVVALQLPEKESESLSGQLADALAKQLGVDTIREDISPALEGLSCYRRRDAAIQRVFPEYQPGWDVRIVLPGSLLEGDTLNIFHLEVKNPNGEAQRQRLPLQEYREIVAASNFKQRVRTNFLYFHAESRNFAVIGTPNRNEHDLGFFVRGGDGLYDIAPIRHLYKTQVYQLAAFLEIPQEIRDRKPTTDTYPGAGSQEDFFYRLPFELLDAIAAGLDQGIPEEQITTTLGITAEQLGFVRRDLRSRSQGTAYLRLPPGGFQADNPVC